LLIVKLELYSEHPHIHTNEKNFLERSKHGRKVRELRMKEERKKRRKKAG